MLRGCLTATILFGLALLLMYWILLWSLALVA